MNSISTFRYVTAPVSPLRKFLSLGSLFRDHPLQDTIFAVSSALITVSEMVRNVVRMKKFFILSK